MFLRPATALMPLVLIIILASGVFAAPQTLTGVVTDTMCGKKHMIPGKSEADCTRECMESKGNRTYGLVAGAKIYRLTGDSKQFDALAGQRVKVRGDVTESTLRVQSIAAVR